MNRYIGLHLRLTDTLTALAQKALALNIPILQFFLIKQGSSRLFEPSHEDIENFLLLRPHFKQIYIHASYWSNLSDSTRHHHPIFMREIALAQQIKATHLVVHSGSIKSGTTMQSSICALARVINTTVNNVSDVTLVLENSAHGRPSVGGLLTDFVEILNQVARPDSIKFCIDTAHAYLCGYNIAHASGRQAFIELIATTLGFHRLQLIHLNDTTQPLGSHLDRHALIGKGVIGSDNLQALSLAPELASIPLLMELPFISDQEEKESLDLVRSWHS